MSKHKKGSQSKVAMVAPTPRAPGFSKERQLAEILDMFGNDRAYTLLRYHGNVFKVLFEGDSEPSIVKLEDGKPVIIKASEIE